jgi:segregation and condensation protein A
VNACTITLPLFEGPLDLLLYLVEKQELDIQSISVARVAEQYLAYLQQLTELDLDVASEFYLMAVRLLSIKARSLLPQPKRSGAGVLEARGAAGGPGAGTGGLGSAADGNGSEVDDGGDGRETLIRELEEYRSFRRRAALLGELAQEQAKRYGRPAASPWSSQAAAWLDYPAKAPPPAALYDAYLAVLARHRARLPRVITPEALTVRRRMADVLRYLRRSGATLFSGLARASASRRDVVVTFLALLELIRRRRIRVEQPAPFADLAISMAERFRFRQRQAAR